MNRNDRKILAWAKKQGLKTKDVPNKLHQIKRQTTPKKHLKIEIGRTILIKNNEVL